jgi:ribosome-binding protein aMBF1 (putative translation factor)
MKQTDKLKNYQANLIERAVDKLGSQAALANRLKIARQSITRWKHGKTIMSSLTMLKIEELLKIKN